MPVTSQPEAGLVGRILASAKYRALDPGLVGRVAAEASARFRDQREALKYAKRKLHQMFGAFQAGVPAKAVIEAVASVGAGRADLRTAALAAMGAHSSSAERAPWLTPFYEQVADWCGTPASVADLACGLNPLAMPWMRLAPDATYWACEIDTALVDALASLDQIMPARLTVTTADLVTAPPACQAEVAFLLKTITTLDQQDQGACGRVLAALDCAHVIVSLPRASLSGRRRYLADPGQVVRAAAEGSRYQVAQSAVFGGEMVFHLTG